MPQELYSLCHQALFAQSPEEKTALTKALADVQQSGRLAKDSGQSIEEIIHPGYPEQLLFVAPHRVEKRGAGSLKGRIHLFHAIAHIEFSSINLALDAVYRFREMPDQFVTDWLTVAAEEAYHFTMIREHLKTMGVDYGEYAVHDGLWEVARKTADDALARMALVPRYLEARGLDVNPGMQKKLQAAGDMEGVNILQIILQDEIRHVAHGDYWFRHLCEQRKLEPESTYRKLVEQHTKHPWRGPFHCAARKQAGFSLSELSDLGCAESEINS